ncbi:MAG: acyl-CoA dehydrogenase family protein [Aeromicrobium sp.]
MDLLPSSDQLEIVGSVADLLRDQVPLDLVRKHNPDGEPSAAWTSLADLGLLGLAIGEELGGIGLGLSEQVLVFRELGRGLTPGPVLGTVLAAHLAADAGDAALVERIIGGGTRVALAEAYRDPSATIGDTVSGALRVLDPTGSDLTLVVSPTSAALIESSALSPTAVSSMDPTVGVATATANGVAPVVGAGDHRTWWRGAALVAAQQVGIAEATRDASAAYAGLREQYGKPIGMFQAVKHRCADMALRAESAYFQTVYAALAWEGGEAAGTYHLASARVVASGASRLNSADNIVNHGAMGFSDETDAHLYARRSIVLETTLGTERWHLESIGRTESADW